MIARSHSIKQQAARYHSFAIVPEYAVATQLHAMAKKELHLYGARWRCTLCHYNESSFEILLWEPK